MDAKHADDYLASLKHQRRLAPATLENYRRAIDLLLTLRDGEALAKMELNEIRRAIALLHARGLSPRTLALVLSAWRGWFRWLARHRGFGANPVLGVRAPKAARPLPKALSVENAQQLLASSKENSVFEKRDLAMFELLYSSGLRLAELVLDPAFLGDVGGDLEEAGGAAFGVAAQRPAAQHPECSPIHSNR